MAGSPSTLPLSTVILEKPSARTAVPDVVMVPPETTTSPDPVAATAPVAAFWVAVSVAPPMVVFEPSRPMTATFGPVMVPPEMVSLLELSMAGWFVE